MLPSPPQPLSDAEWLRLCSIAQRRRNGMESPPEDLNWLDTVGPRLRLWKWPPPVIPPEKLHPQIMIPIMIPAMYLAQVNDLMNTGA